MTELERLSLVGHMEKMIREFSIISAGNGVVEGGFGRLPVSDNIEDRINNIHRSINEFRLEGSGIDVAGDFDNGFALS